MRGISGWDELDQNFKNVGRNVGRVGPEFRVVRGVLIQAHCPGYETRGSPVFGGRPIFCRARPYRNDPCFLNLSGGARKKFEFSACLTRFFPLRNPSRFRPGVPRGSGRLQCRRRRRRQRHSLHCLQVAKAGFGLSAILGELVLSA